MADLAFEDASEHYRVAVDSLGAGADAELRYRMLIALGSALNAIGDIEAAAPRWLEAAQLAGEMAHPERMLDCLEGFAGMLRLDGDPWVAALVDTLMHLLPPGDSAVRARALGWRTRIRSPGGSARTNRVPIPSNTIVGGQPRRWRWPNGSATCRRWPPSPARS